MSLLSSDVGVNPQRDLQNVLAQSVRAGALRWLHHLDLDVTSRTYGVGDREYWAWKTKDFANGTWQGGLAGFLDAHDLLPFPTEQLESIVTAVISGTMRIQRQNGSFEEAYPYESSYCVTALVLFDCLYAYGLYPQFFTASTRQQLLQITESALAFILKTPETHGVIANHLATGLMAVYLACDVLKRPFDDQLFHDFLQLQHSTEGWFPEYGLADPGYQTLLNHYVLAAHRVKPLPSQFSLAIESSLEFVTPFCFPDGSFAAEVGGRGTGIVYPGGLLMLDQQTLSQPMAWFLQQHQQHLNAVTPVTADAGNMVPVWNSWAMAYALLRQQKHGEFPQHATIEAITVHRLDAAQMIVVQSPQAVLVSSTQNGVIRKVQWHGDHGWCDDSMVGFVSHDESTQAGQVCGLSVDAQQIQYQLTANDRKKPLNSAWKMIVLRALAMVLYPFPFLQRVLKQQMARIVMSCHYELGAPIAEVCIQLDDPVLPIRCKVKKGWQACRVGFHRHMASANTFDVRVLQSPPDVTGW